MLISSISDVGWYYCKWIDNRSRFRSSNAELGLAVMSGSAAAQSAVLEPLVKVACGGTLPKDQAEQTLAMFPPTQHSVSARAPDLTSRRSFDLRNSVSPPSKHLQPGNPDVNQKQCCISA
jgi:hypothetical protein